MKELLFYAVNREYIKYLSMYDEHVSYNKDDIGHSRPYLGIVLEIKCYRYFVPCIHTKSIMKNTRIIQVSFLYMIEKGDH